MPAQPAALDDQFFKLAIAATVFSVVLLTGYFAFMVTLPYDRLGYLVGRDFVNTWMGARIAVHGDPAVWFDLLSYNTALQETFRRGFPLHNWSYPPHLLLFTWPLAFTPYLTGLFLWTSAGFAALLAAVSPFERRPPRLIFICLAPAVALNAFAGQNGMFTAALMIFALTNLDRRPIWAGIAIGCLTIKPQLGVLIPLMLILTGRWRVFASAAATTLTLAGLTAAVFGPDIWRAYLEVALPIQKIILDKMTGIAAPMMPTPFQNMRVIGMPPEVCWAVQIGPSLAAVSAVIWTFWRKRDPDLSLALFVTAAFAAIPYAFNYDMVVFGWVVMLVLTRADSTVLDRRLAIAVWLLPVVTVILGLLYIPLSSLILLAFGARLVQRLFETSRDEDGSQTLLAVSNAEQSRPSPRQGILVPRTYIHTQGSMAQ